MAGAGGTSIDQIGNRNTNPPVLQPTLVDHGDASLARITLEQVLRDASVMSQHLIDDRISGMTLESIEVIDQSHVIGLSRLGHDIGNVDLEGGALEYPPTDSLDQQGWDDAGEQTAWAEHDQVCLFDGLCNICRRFIDPWTLAATGWSQRPREWQP